MSGRQAYVFFDVDDTLVQWTVSWGEVFAQVAREAGVRVSEEDALGALDSAFSTFYGEYLKKHAALGDEREFWLDYNARILETLGVKDAPRKAAARVTELLRMPYPIQLFPEVPEVLATLAAGGARLGIITGRPRAAPDLESLGVLHYFDPVLDGLSMGEAKRIGSAAFARAAEVVSAAGAVGWHVGDSYEHDVRAAQAVGIQGVLVDRDGREKGADCPRVADLRALPEMIAQA